jgi:hypothetical protein
MFGTARGISAHHLNQIRQDVVDHLGEHVDAELTEVYGDDAEASDTVLFDLLDCDPDPCPGNPGGHLYVTRCGETVCAHCPKVVG